MCDPGYSGSDCSVPDTPNADFLKEDFEGTPICRKLMYVWSFGVFGHMMDFCLGLFAQGELWIQIISDC